ncbi:hypothetical protein BpHYR1_013172 [Brachionus plicatilis]|uniref:Uncharacterized protein n=1 Tax=Brachionus plicatilis TaxID=10195 RepID=A0A3M7T372_BRAPC|nr:hypothetical protein BpHYR1_013172 [Brachionus plicatilis]
MICIRKKDYCLSTKEKKREYLQRENLIPFAFSKIGSNAVILKDNDCKHNAFFNKKFDSFIEFNFVVF